jgi:hypothetical protein
LLTAISLRGTAVSTAQSTSTFSHLAESKKVGGGLCSWCSGRP